MTDPVYRDTRDDRTGTCIGYDGKHFRLRDRAGRVWSCPVSLTRQVAARRERQSL